MRSSGWLAMVVVLFAAGVAAAETDAERGEARQAAEEAAAAEVEAGRFVKAAELLEAFIKAHPHPSNQDSYSSPAKMAKDYRARAAVAEKAKANGRDELRALVAVAAFPSSGGLSLSERATGPSYLRQVLQRLRAVDKPLDALLSRKVKVVAGEVDGLTQMELGLVIDGITGALRELGIEADTGTGDDLFTVAAAAAAPANAGIGASMLSCSIRVTGRWTSGPMLVLPAVDLTVTKPAFTPELARQNAAAAVGEHAGPKLLKAVLAAPPIPAR